MLVLSGVPSANSQSAADGGPIREKDFPAKGVVQSINRTERQIVIRHEAISNYMGTMTMPFKVKDSNGLAGLQAGDEISFHLHVTGTENWVY